MKSDLCRSSLVRTFVIFLSLFSSLSPWRESEAAAAKVAADTLTIREAFANLPLDVVEIIPRRIRLDMLDYLEHGEMKPVRNSMNGMSSIVAPVSDSLLNVEVTASSHLTIRLLPAKKGSLAMCIYTLGSDRQARDSEVRFFNGAMQMLKTSKYFPTLKLDDFLDLSRLSDKEKKTVKAMVPFPTVEYNLEPGSTSIRVRLSVGTFMGEEDFDRLKPYMRDRRLVWNGSKYILSPSYLPATLFPEPAPIFSE